MLILATDADEGMAYAITDDSFCMAYSRDGIGLAPFIDGFHRSEVDPAQSAWTGWGDSDCIFEQWLACPESL
jgi:hypothetical protein